jgi:hypothetical protein
MWCLAVMRHAPCRLKHVLLEVRRQEEIHPAVRKPQVRGYPMVACFMVAELDSGADLGL